MEQLTLSLEVSPAKMYPWLDAVRDWLESEAAYGGNSVELLEAIARAGLLSRMSPAFYPATPAGTLPSSFGGWSNAGIASHGGFWTLSISDSPKDAAACSLSAVLEMEVAPKYYLSPKACRGILARAERREKALPTHLRLALAAASLEAEGKDKTP